MNSVDSAIKTRKIAVAHTVPLYDSSGQMIEKVDGDIVRCEYGTGLGWPKEGIRYSVAFVWNETVGPVRNSGPEHACVLAQGEEAKATLDGMDFSIKLTNREIQIQKAKDGVYQVATNEL